LIKIIKLVWLAQMAVSAVMIATDAKYADLNLYLTHLLKNALSCVVMEKDTISNVMMEIISTVMDAQEIVN